jgi:hypothetical protein
MTQPYTPYATFSGVPFDFARGQPQKVRKNGADYYTGQIVVYGQNQMDALWALRVVINVTPVGDATQKVYVDSWQPPSAIQHVLTMRGGSEVHIAILSDLSWSERLLSAADTPNGPYGLVFNANAEFLLLS